MFYTDWSLFLYRLGRRGWTDEHLSAFFLANQSRFDIFQMTFQTSFLSFTVKAERPLSDLDLKTTWR